MYKTSTRTNSEDESMTNTQHRPLGIYNSDEVVERSSTRFLKVLQLYAMAVFALWCLLPSLLVSVLATPTLILTGTLGGGCIVHEYKTTKVTNLTDTDPDQGWVTFNGHTCTAVSECKCFLIFPSVHQPPTDLSVLN